MPNHLRMNFIESCLLVALVGLPACSRIHPAPKLDAKRISKTWDIPTAEQPRLDLAVSLVNDRFATAASDPLLVNAADYNENTPLNVDGTTRGLGHIEVSVEFVPSEGKPASLNPVVASLTTDAQKAIFDASKANRSAVEIKQILETVTIPEKAPKPLDFLQPQYRLRISSDVSTGNIYDRYDEVYTLVVLDKSVNPDATIRSIIPVADSEITLNFGNLEREETTRFKLSGNLTANVAAVPVNPGGTAGGSGSVSGEYENTFREKILKSLAEKVLKTSAYGLTGPFESTGMAVVQIGSRDYKLRQTLAQNLVIAVGQQKKSAKLWKITRTKPEPDSDWKLGLVEFPLPGSQKVSAHVVSLGIVRVITKEKKNRVQNEEHTPEEGDDKTERHIVTNYQHINFPEPALANYNIVALSRTPSELPFQVYTPAMDEAHPATFLTLEDAETFRQALLDSKNPWVDGQVGIAHGKAHKVIKGVYAIIPAFDKASDVIAHLDTMLVRRQDLSTAGK